MGTRLRRFFRPVAVVSVETIPPPGYPVIVVEEMDESVEVEETVELVLGARPPRGHVAD